jgi:hypothetical protein
MPGLMRRLLRLLACAGVGVVLGVSVYVGLVQSGLAPSPFDPLVRGDIALARSARPGLRVLFVGNSFTFRNGLARMVHDLAVNDPGGSQLFAVEYAAPGWSFEDAAKDDGLTGLLTDVRWNVVVLQEQSQLLAFTRGEWQRETFPFARALHDKISRDGADTLLFMTWGYKHGDQHNWPGDTFADMQGRLSEGYSALASELQASVAPAGLAWAEALRRRPGLDLWESDGKHPNKRGSYLAACVFYEILTGRGPFRTTFTAGLQPSEARFLQGVADSVVRETQTSSRAVRGSATFATGS